MELNIDIDKAGKIALIVGAILLFLIVAYIIYVQIRINRTIADNPDFSGPPIDIPTV